MLSAYPIRAGRFHTHLVECRQKHGARQAEEDDAQAVLRQNMFFVIFPRSTWRCPFFFDLPVRLRCRRESGQVDRATTMTLSGISVLCRRPPIISYIPAYHHFQVETYRGNIVTQLFLQPGWESFAWDLPDLKVRRYKIRTENAVATSGRPPSGVLCRTNTA